MLAIIIRSPFLCALRGSKTMNTDQLRLFLVIARFAQPRRRSSLTQIATCGQPSLRTRAELFRLTGVDLVAVHGMSASLAQITRRVSDMGTDISKWPTQQHFASWLGLAPHNDISGGRILRCRTWPTDNRAGQAFRQAAASVTRSLCAFC